MSRRVTKEVLEDRSDDKLEMFVRDDLLQDKVYDFQRLTPLTPSLQSNEQRIALWKLTAERYVLSANSDLDLDLSSKHCDILGANVPDILKDSSTPVSSVKFALDLNLVLDDSLCMWMGLRFTL
ncbi:hypothetical protein Ancab_002451 [Ancistrocladus abbreviatus]